MRRGKGYSVSTSLVSFACMLGLGIGRAGMQGVAAGRTVTEVKVTDEVKEIELKLDGVSTIEFAVTDDVFGVEGLSYSPGGRNPLHVEDAGSRLVLTQKFEDASWREETSASYRLLVPRGRRWVVNTGNAVFSGAIAAADVTIKAGHLETRDLSLDVDGDVKITGGIAKLDMRVRRAERIQLGFGLISGRLVVPESVKVSNKSGNSMGLRLYLAA